MESGNKKRIDTYEENEWVEKDEENNFGDIKNVDYSVSSNIEDVLISNRTTENENEEMTGEYMFSSDISMKGGEKNEYKRVIHKEINKEDISIGNNHNYVMNDNNNDDNNNIENNVYNNIEENIQSINFIDHQVTPEKMNILISNDNNHIINENIHIDSNNHYNMHIDHTHTHSDNIYKNKNENSNDQFKEVKDESSNNPVDELMKDIKMFNNSMQSISSTNNLSFQKNLSKMYSELASNKNLESLHNLFKDTSFGGNIEKAQFLKNILLASCLPQNGIGINKNEVTISKDIENNKEVLNINNKVSISDQRNVQVSNCINEKKNSNCISNEYTEEFNLENLNESQNLISNIEPTTVMFLSSNKKNLDVKEGDEKLGKKETKNILEHVKINTNDLNIRDDISPLNLNQYKETSMINIWNKSSSKKKNISSNEWDKMKKSFCNIENNLIDFNKLNMTSNENIIEGIQNQIVHEEMKNIETSPYINYLSNDNIMTLGNTNISNERFPALDYVEQMGSNETMFIDNFEKYQVPMEHNSNFFHLYNSNDSSKVSCADQDNNKMDMDNMNNKVDLDNMNNKMDMDNMNNKMDVDNMNNKVDLDNMNNKMDVDNMNNKINVDNMNNKMDVDNMNNKINVDNMNNKINVDNMNNKLYVDNMNNKLYVDNINNKLYVDNINNKLYVDNINNDIYMDNINNEIYMDDNNNYKYNNVGGDENNNDDMDKHNSIYKHMPTRCHINNISPTNSGDRSKMSSPALQSMKTKIVNTNLLTKEEEVGSSLKICKNEFTKIEHTKVNTVKIKSPKNVSKVCQNKSAINIPKVVKVKSKTNENIKTPKITKRNSDSSTTARVDQKMNVSQINNNNNNNNNNVNVNNHVTVNNNVSMNNHIHVHESSNNHGGNSSSPVHQNGILTNNICVKNNKNEKNPSGEKDITYNMNVVIRCRPMSISEKNDGAKNVIKILENKMVVLLDPSDNTDNVLRQNRSREKKYVFDYVFDENSSQEDVYNNSVKCLIDAVIKGYNSTVFAYGATGAGKTHTIIGYKNEPGIMMMILKDLFERIKMLEIMNEYKVKCSFIEIYNENICDLLNPSSEYLDVREDPIKGVTVSNIFEVCTTSVEEIMELIHTGNRNRTQEPTDANKTSSRSHGVLQVIVEETEKGQGVYQQTKRGKLCVIDLAGSERASQTNNKGMRMLEGANINRSLLALGNVINALVLRSKGNSKSNFIPFRDSKLTRLLKDSLGGNCKTVMIANISPSHLSYEDTHNTLKYANRAKNIKNVVTSNSIVVKHHLTMYIDVIEKLKNEIEFLKEQLNEKDKMHGYMNSNSTNYDYYDQLKDYEKNYSKEELIHIIALLKKENQRLKMCDTHEGGINNNESGGINNNNNDEEHNIVDDHFNHNEYNNNNNNDNNSTKLEDDMLTNKHNEELAKYKEEVNNLKMMNEKLFMDNKNFQLKLQEYVNISKNLKTLNEEYKKQIEGFKSMVHNHDKNHIQIKKKLDDLKKKYAQLKESTDDKDNDDVLEKWKNELTKNILEIIIHNGYLLYHKFGYLLNERKKIKMIILDIERKLIQNKEIGTHEISDDDIKVLQENKTRMDHQLKLNILQTNNLIKDLPIKIKDEKMKNFLYLFYTNKVLLQEKEELQDFFELSSTIINQKEKQIEDLKEQLKGINVSITSKK
ncbi:kinesin-8,putative [Plasmodium sp. DRC-Itaito]|nr:kinesin-8,putative [Plasmodium sp. DRC-Itaito]